MAFKVLMSKSSGSNLPSAEEFYQDNQEAFVDGDVVDYIKSIELTERGYRLCTTFCTLFCSYKFWSMAKVLKGYLAKQKQDTVVPALMVSISAPAASGYCDWSLGTDEGKDGKQAKTILDYDLEDNLASVTFIQPECLSQYPEGWTYNSYQPDPITPSVKKPRSRLKKQADASSIDSAT